MLKIANDLIYNLPLEKKHRFPMLKYKLLPDLLIKEGTCTNDNFFCPSDICDDDIPAAQDTPLLPTKYRHKMFHKAVTEFTPMLNSANLLVMTSNYLFNKYSTDRTKYLPPIFTSIDRPQTDNSQKEKIKFCYHGTDVHAEDLKFLSLICSL